MLRREEQISLSKTLIIKNLNSIVLIHPNSQKIKEKLYRFDRIFQENSKQSEIFKETTEELVNFALDGFNSTVFAYGPTGTGKTFTMFGENEKAGLIQMTIFDVFDKILEKSERIYTVLLSYLEIYNEVLKDLLNPTSGVLDIREDPGKGILISDLFEARVSNAEEMIELVRTGNKMRTVEAAEQNSSSSRSHGILIINIEFIDKCSGIQSQVFSSKFFLVDLAGSERASKNRGLRQIEGANINKSLLALGNCINALSESKGIKGFVPYRDSKLTRILKDSLGGKCRTAMITCVAPCVNYYDDTYNALEYANRVKNIKTKVEKNVLSIDHQQSFNINKSSMISEKNSKN
jgi:kinesin family protein 18/19